MRSIRLLAWYAASSAEGVRLCQPMGLHGECRDWPVGLLRRLGELSDVYRDYRCYSATVYSSHVRPEMRQVALCARHCSSTQVEIRDDLV